MKRIALKTSPFPVLIACLLTIGILFLISMLPLELRSACSTSLRSR